MIQLEIPNLRGKELGQYLNEKLEEIADEVVTSPDLLLEFVNKWENGFHRYSISNIILAGSQKPDFTLLAGYKHGRNTKGK